MGRPLKARYFVKGGANDPSNIVQYKGIKNVVIATTGTHYSQGATAVVALPDDTGPGVTATISLTISAYNGTPAGGITGATITNVGSGYKNAPTVSVVPAPTQTATVTTNTTNALTLTGINGLYVGMKAVGTGINSGTTYVTTINAGTKTVTLSNNNASSNLVGNVISFQDTGANAAITVSTTAVELIPGTIATSAYIPVANGGSSAATSAIIKQKGSRSFLVENDQGRGQVKLVAGSVTAGTMSIIATDFNGSTYYVNKISGRKAHLVQKTSAGAGFIIANNTPTAWTTTGIATGTIVTLATNAI
jgi:hypothetical protein